MANGNEHIIIFEHRDFRGRHRHIFGKEANLNHREDSTLNDRMSSFVILSGTWRFFRHTDFNQQVGRDLGPGQYEWVENYGVANDEISSLRAV
jgi:Beta/Gamma crystallin